MPGQSWTTAETALLKALVQQGLTTEKIAARFREEGIARSQKAISRKIANERDRGGGWHAATPPSRARRYDQPIELEGNALILADIHCPFQDARFIDAAIDLAQQYAIDAAILAGDLADFNAFSAFGRDAGLDADEELDALAELVDRIAANFDRVAYFAGNHDLRPLKPVKYAGMTLTRLARMFTPDADDKHFMVSDYAWCRLRSGGVLWHIEHPQNASVNATYVARRLAAKFECSVVTAHGHTWGLAKSDSGLHWAVDSGICADPLRLGYTQLVHNTRPVQQQGAVLIIDGLPLLVNPQTIGMFTR